MIFALGTQIFARFKPWVFPWIIKPDALMVSAIDLISNKRAFQQLQKKGLRGLLAWDGLLICDSGAYSAINRKKKVDLNIEKLKDIYRELAREDTDIIKITLDFPDEKIVSNYSELQNFNVMPVLPYNREELIEQLAEVNDNPEWVFLGRLVPLMRKGGQFTRIFNTLDNMSQVLRNGPFKDSKVWALGIGAPSIIEKLQSKVDGCDSARWRITSSNMILLPGGGERGVGNKTKWRGTHIRIEEGEELKHVVNVLKEIDEESEGLEGLDSNLARDRKVKPINGSIIDSLPTIGQLLDKLRSKPEEMTIRDVEMLLRSSSNLRFLFNYMSALAYKK
ncbi:MAG: hypothetical protein ACTSW1_02070 [Candidatus Hodarchaeales archaeon]